MAVPAQKFEYFIIEKLNLQKISHTAKIFCSDGTIICDKFDYKDRFYCGYSWWGHDYGFLDDDMYIDDLKSVAKTFGYDEETIDALMEEGFTPDEIEEYIYCCELQG